MSSNGKIETAIKGKRDTHRHRETADRETADRETPTERQKYIQTKRS